MSILVVLAGGTGKGSGGCLEVRVPGTRRVQSRREDRLHPRDQRVRSRGCKSGATGAWCRGAGRRGVVQACSGRGRSWPGSRTEEGDFRPWFGQGSRSWGAGCLRSGVAVLHGRADGHTTATFSRHHRTGKGAGRTSRSDQRGVHNGQSRASRRWCRCAMLGGYRLSPRPRDPVTVIARSVLMHTFNEPPSAHG